MNTVAYEILIYLETMYEKYVETYLKIPDFPWYEDIFIFLVILFILMLIYSSWNDSVQEKYGYSLLEKGHLLAMAVSGAAMFGGLWWRDSLIEKGQESLDWKAALLFGALIAFFNLCSLIMSFREIKRKYLFLNIFMNLLVFAIFFLLTGIFFTIAAFFLVCGFFACFDKNKPKRRRKTDQEIWEEEEKQRKIARDTPTLNL